MSLIPLFALGSGALIGLSLGAMGGGGSLIAIPLLVYVVGTTVQEAAALSLFVVAFSALLGIYQHYRAGQVRVKAALVFSGTGALAAWAGAQGHRFVREEVTLLLFALLMVFVAIRMVQQGSASGTASADSCAERFPRSCWIKVSGLGALVGLLTGFFGVGGGFVIVPALVLVLGFPMPLAVGTSLVIIALVSLGGVLGHLSVGALDWRLAAPLLAGAAGGMVSGPRIGRAVSGQTLARTFAVLILGIAAMLLIQNGPKVVGGLG